LAFYFIITSILLIALISYVSIVGPDHLFINNAIYHLFRSIRTTTVDSIMIAITLLGQKQIILPVVFALCIWLFMTKRIRAGLHALALGILAATSVLMIKNLTHIERPWGIAGSMDTHYSMPSGHTTLAAMVYMGMAFIIALPLLPKRRWMVYTPALAIVLAVSISRLYLGAHWFTDVLAAWLLSAALLMIVILSYNQRAEKPIHLTSLFMVFLTTLCLTYSFYCYYHFDRLKNDYAQLSWPTQTITMTAWWENNQATVSRVSLFGIPSQYINVEWMGSLTEIKRSLLKAGWTNPPARDWVSTLHRMSDIKSYEYLPMVSPQFLDKKPALILTKPLGRKKTLVLRLWESNQLIKENNQMLWVGTIGLIPRSYGWLFKKNQTLPIDPAFVMTPQTDEKAWEWKMLTVSTTADKQKILLIKKKTAKQTTTPNKNMGKIKK
jgi:undecaprenyl-diphosphatase